MRLIRSIYFGLVCQFISVFTFAQSLPVGTPLLEEYFRREQLQGKIDLNISFTVRPINFKTLLNDSASQKGDDLLVSKIVFKSITDRNKLKTYLLPISLKQQYNTNHPFGWNDGSMIPAKGYQGQLSFGVFSQLGPLTIQLKPEFVFAQNSPFNTFPSAHSDSVWKSYYHILNRIDNPERFGSGSYIKLFPGQSSIRYNYKKLSLGLSTENLWWGPGVRNALIMSNNALGFGHITINTNEPIKTGIGSFEWQVVSGLLKESGILPPDTSRTYEGQKLYVPKPKGDRYLNGMVVTWQPKWTPGLHLGFSRVFYQYKSNIANSLNGYLPIVTAFFKSNSQDESSYGRDQMFSLFARLILPESKAEVYGDYGRNDHSQNLRDLLLEPEHTRAYLFGVRKLFPTKKGKELELFFEMSQLQNSSTKDVREQEGWYTHYQVRHGYTNNGQVIGAGIGPGGSSQTIGLNWLKGIKTFSATIDRIVHNNDFYYGNYNYPGAFSPSRNFSRHWVDLAFNLNKSWLKRRFLYSADISLVRSYNYQWYYDALKDENLDATNLKFGFSIYYSFQ